MPGNDIAQVDVAGVVRHINIGMLDGPFAAGDYLVIHSGFALERMTAQEAHEAFELLTDDPTAGPPFAERTG